MSGCRAEAIASGGCRRRCRAQVRQQAQQQRGVHVLQHRLRVGGRSVVGNRLKFAECSALAQQ